LPTGIPRGTGRCGCGGLFAARVRGSTGCFEPRGACWAVARCRTSSPRCKVAAQVRRCLLDRQRSWRSASHHRRRHKHGNTVGMVVMRRARPQPGCPGTWHRRTTVPATDPPTLCSSLARPFPATHAPRRPVRAGSDAPDDHQQRVTPAAVCTRITDIQRTVEWQNTTIVESSGVRIARTHARSTRASRCKDSSRSMIYDNA